MLAGGVAVAAVAAGGAIVAGGGEAPVRAAEPTVARATATVERRDLVDREDLEGTLGYADPGTLAAGVAGTLTALRDPGSKVTRGHSLYAVDGAAAAFLLYGELPAWRDFDSSMSDGEDVRQLERNLRALGYDPGDVNDDWSWKTTEAVEDFQRDRELDDDGTLVARRGRLPARARSGSARPKADVGDQVSPGRPVTEFSSTEQVVTVALDASRQRLARVGDRVTVDAAVRPDRRRAHRGGRQGRDQGRGGDDDRGHDRRARRRATSTRRRSTSASRSSAARARWPCR